MRHPLPPLNAVRAFECAARHGSYVGAADELGVSPAAVSQQVRNLEDFLGKQLFRRYNNRIALTDAGQTIYSGASDALQSLSALTEQVVSGRARSRLVISSVPSMAERWIAPKLGHYRQRAPNFRFELRSEEDLVDFIRHEIDLRLSYGLNHYPDMVSIPLVQDEVVPMCSPAYAARNPDAERLGLSAVPDDDLIHTNWGPSFVSHPTWQLWLAAERRVPDETRGYRVGSSSLALDLAVRGVGVALGHPYCLVYPPAKARKAGLIDLVNWLKSAPTETGPAAPARSPISAPGFRA
jgi:LysR family transcriptional regulator, glycine cleavage system transcriptional activator